MEPHLSDSPYELIPHQLKAAKTFGMDSHNRTCAKQPICPPDPLR
jgi:hypothetical protein